MRRKEPKNDTERKAPQIGLLGSGPSRPPNLCPCPDRVISIKLPFPRRLEIQYYEKHRKPDKGWAFPNKGIIGTAMSDEDKNGQDGTETGVVIKSKPKAKKPSMYKVLMLNDDYTPMEFVVHVLERFFGKGREEATQIMLQVHRRGVGLCGVYTYEVAETKVTQVIDFARQHQHPLQCTLERE